jgi:hypothetical protein
MLFSLNIETFCQEVVETFDHGAGGVETRWIIFGDNQGSRSFCVDLLVKRLTHRLLNSSTPQPLA